MTDEEFDDLLRDAHEQLREKQSVLTDKYRLGTSGQFVVDYAEGILTTFDHEKPVAEAKIIPVATHFPDRETLLWAWSNDRLPAELRAKSAEIKGLYEVTGLDVFRNERITCDEAMAWEVTALACKHLGAIGAYRIPHNNTHGYVLITEIKAFG